MIKRPPSTCQQLVGLAETHLSTPGAVSGQIHQDFYISQLIRQLEDLDISSGIRAQKTFPSTLNSSIYPTTCCSPSESTSVQSQPQRAQFRMIHRRPTIDIHHLNSRLRHRRSTKHSQGEGRDTSSSESLLKITPVQVAYTASPRDRRRSNGERRVKTFYCWGPMNDRAGLGSGTSADGSKRNGSSTPADIHSDASDLSDQEKGGAQAHEWVTPAVALRLRPEPFDLDHDLHFPASSEAQSPFAEVLPAPLEVLDLTRSLPSTAEWESRQSLHMREPSLAAIVSRLSEMEDLQAATVQRELTKTGRCRPATAVSLTRSTSRLRKADFPGSKPVFVPTGGYGSVVSSFTELSLSRDSRPRQTCAPYKQNHIRVGSRPHTVFKRPRSSSAKLNRTETLVQVQSWGEGSTPKPTGCTKIRKAKANKKGTLSSHRVSPPNSAKKTKARDLRKA
ncbi:hypothetical protein J4Q44_G00266330 [Coregonus suidteri]|uniref:Uncharacterized protein n=1 Tax=Coregonus suidteri TaxID=861788 RepID=A0AAN8L251_9TELE